MGVIAGSCLQRLGQPRGCRGGDMTSWRVFLNRCRACGLPPLCAAAAEPRCAARCAPGPPHPLTSGCVLCGVGVPRPRGACVSREPKRYALPMQCWLLYVRRQRCPPSRSPPLPPPLPRHRQCAALRPRSRAHIFPLQQAALRDVRVGAAGDCEGPLVGGGRDPGPLGAFPAVRVRARSLLGSRFTPPPVRRMRCQTNKAACVRTPPPVEWC